MDKPEVILLKIERLYNSLKYELHRLHQENRVLRKKIKIYDNNNETSQSSEESETEKKI